MFLLTSVRLLFVVANRARQPALMAHYSSASGSAPTLTECVSVKGQNILFSSNSSQINHVKQFHLHTYQERQISEVIV